MSYREVKIWKPIQFDEKWLDTNTSYFDEIVDSWHYRKKELGDDNIEFKKFIDELKREHAIETGIIERLYDLDRGVTQTFIEEGFKEAYLSHNDTNISPSELMNYLHTHLNVIDFIFDFVKEKRPFSRNYILQIHQELLKHQEYTKAIDSLGREVKVPLLKGIFKKYPNNPKRNGTVFLYCPPEQVDSEVDKLLNLYNELEEKNIHPIIISAWFHHAFTQIHPFQDGNGRMARLLSTLILIKHQLFPFNLLREERNDYIDALENADKGQYQDLVFLFCKIQKRNIQKALNIFTSRASTPQQAIMLLNEKILASQTNTKRTETLNNNRNILFNHLFNILNNIVSETNKNLRNNFIKFTLDAFLDASLINNRCNQNIQIKEIKINNETRKYAFEDSIIYFTAKQFNYNYNEKLPKAWFNISLEFIDKKITYNLLISLHHYGFIDSAVALGIYVYMIHIENKISEIFPLKIKRGSKEEILEPYVLSIEKEPSDKTIKNIEKYLNEGITEAINYIASQIV